MHEAGSSAFRRSEAQIGASSLEIKKVRTGRNLEPFGAPGRPRFEIDLVSGGERKIARAHLQDAIRQTETGQHVLRFADQSRVFLDRLVGMAEFDHLNLFELITAFDAAD